VPHFTISRCFRVSECKSVEDDSAEVTSTFSVDSQVS
jgi:hypothetical protein